MKRFVLPLAFVAILGGASVAEASGGLFRSRVSSFSAGCGSVQAFSSCSYAAPLIQSYSLVQPFVAVQAYAAVPFVQAVAYPVAVRQKAIVQQVRVKQVQQIQQKQVIRQRALIRY